MPSSPIGVLQRHCADTDSTCPEPSRLTCLADVLGRISDPRRVRGRRYRLGSLLALCMVAFLGGATSLAAIARFAADTDSDLREQLGLTSSTPNASTLGRLLARLDGDALYDAVAPGPPGTPPTRSTNPVTPWSVWPSTARPCEDPAPTAQPSTCSPPHTPARP
ncbi:transposase family protein [Streptomyces sp. GbtcB7]|uniref:transposase family protein n=1 Tax=Streptomyces sp. GbtcB7 TaxID=2824752 RepID=UPI001C3073B1|nr:transposase family protein [Streptomyces sp. GbtcB7]